MTHRPEPKPREHRSSSSPWGSPTIRVAGRRSDGLKPLSREVGFYLLDAGPVERDTLVETFWPEHSPGRQTANLHMAVYQLRQLLGKDSWHWKERPTLFGHSRGLEYDVRRFERSAAIAERLPAGDPRRMFALTEAVNSYGGAFLPEFELGVGDCPPPAASVALPGPADRRRRGVADSATRSAGRHNFCARR